MKIDPLLSLQALIAGRAWVNSAFYGILMLALAFLLGRFFCGWVCPMGTCLDLADRAVHRKKKRKWKNGDRRLRWLKYCVLIVILIGAVSGRNLAYLADPISWITRIFTYSLWPIGTMTTNSLLDILRPFFESLGWFNLARMNLSQPNFGGIGLLAIIFFVVLIWLNRFQHRFWCRTLCPLGALLAIPARFSVFQRNINESCNACGLCAAYCENGAIDSSGESIDPGECIQCGICTRVCRKGAIEAIPGVPVSYVKPSLDLSRRRVLGSIGIGAVASVVLAGNLEDLFASDKVLRPPGAIPETDFLATCVRCGQCAKACPTHCLNPSVLEAGLSGFMSPMALMRSGPCDQNCTSCGEVCPTGAIRRLMPFEKRLAKIGNAVIDRKRCVVWEKSKVCLVCDENCPYGAIYWEENEKGDRRPLVDVVVCNGCGQCEHACPIEGEAAIRVFQKGQIRLFDGAYPPLKRTAEGGRLGKEMKKPAESL